MCRFLDLDCILILFFSVLVVYFASVISCRFVIQVNTLSTTYGQFNQLNWVIFVKGVADLWQPDL